VHVEPGAAEDELHVLREVEDGRDEGEGEEQEEDRVCCREGVWLVCVWTVSDWDGMDGDGWRGRGGGTHRR
jgi:hypothetical protein